MQPDLDVQELLHLSVRASSNGDSGQAILCVKQALALEPDHPTALFLLGGFHADLGLLERACEEIGRAVEVKPEFAGARLQLALLQLICGQPETAQATLSPLTVEDRQDCYGEFARGTSAMIDGRLDVAAGALERGLALNDEDPGLNAQIAHIHQVVAQLLALETDGASDSGATTSREHDDHALRRALLSRYEHQQASDD